MSDKPPQPKPPRGPIKRPRPTPGYRNTAHARIAATLAKLSTAIAAGDVEHALVVLDRARRMLTKMRSTPGSRAKD
jgi:hypothetical protein